MPHVCESAEVYMTIPQCKIVVVHTMAGIVCPA